MSHGRHCVVCNGGVSMEDQKVKVMVTVFDAGGTNSKSYYAHANCGGVKECLEAAAEAARPKEGTK